VKLSETQISKPAAKIKTPSRAANGHSQQRSQSWGQPAREEIAAQAYQLYVESGRQEGRDLENWLRAEQILREPSSGNGASPAAQMAANSDRRAGK
jgi:hypothetical protein